MITYYSSILVGFAFILASCSGDSDPVIPPPPTVTPTLSEDDDMSTLDGAWIIKYSKQLESSENDLLDSSDINDYQMSVWITDHGNGSASGKVCQESVDNAFLINYEVDGNQIDLNSISVEKVNWTNLLWNTTRYSDPSSILLASLEKVSNFGSVSYSILDEFGNIISVVDLPIKCFGLSKVLTTVELVGPHGVSGRTSSFPQEIIEVIAGDNINNFAMKHDDMHMDPVLNIYGGLATDSYTSTLWPIPPGDIPELRSVDDANKEYYFTHGTQSSAVLDRGIELTTLNFIDYVGFLQSSMSGQITLNTDW